MELWTAASIARPLTAPADPYPSAISTHAPTLQRGEPDARGSAHGEVRRAVDDGNEQSAASSSERSDSVKATADSFIVNSGSHTSKLTPVDHLRTDPDDLHHLTGHELRVKRDGSGGGSNP
jgi:hypothetical protein